MRYLLDTHALLWASRGSGQLTPAVSTAIVAASNDIFVSIASYWEISIKASMGKLPLSGTVAAFQARAEAMNIATLAVNVQSLDIVRTLPFHHKDPFDRIIIATAIAEGLTLITVDSEIASYSVPQWWG